MAWIYLAIAGALEIGWGVGLKLSEGFTQWGPTAVTVLCMILSTVFLGLAARDIPIGTAYAVWTGIGAAGIAVIGIVWFGESRDALRMIFLASIVIGTVGLKFVESE
jgi:quaternary ammonium compound-resistance protein SugE